MLRLGDKIKYQCFSSNTSLLGQICQGEYEHSEIFLMIITSDYGYNDSVGEDVLEQV